jgi:hypothetical protein
MDNVTLIRVVAGVLAVMVFITLLFRMKKKAPSSLKVQRGTLCPKAREPEKMILLRYRCDDCGSAEANRARPHNPIEQYVSPFFRQESSLHKLLSQEHCIHFNAWLRTPTVIETAHMFVRVSCWFSRHHQCSRYVLPVPCRTVSRCHNKLGPKSNKDPDFGNGAR